MGFDDRLIFLLIGGAVGFILGYIVRSLRDIKEELDEVDQLIKKNERGAISFGNIVLALVLMVCVYAAVASQLASNKTNHTAVVAADTASVLKKVVTCNQESLANTLVALNERTQFSTTAAQKSIALQESQHNFLSILLHRPPPTAHHALESAKQYNTDSQNYIVVNKKALTKIMNNPIPSVEQFTDCLKRTD